MFKGFLNVSLLCIYFILVHSTPSIPLPYPFTSYPLFSTVFNTYPNYLYLHISYVLWYCWCSIALFSFPSFPEFHSVVSLLQTCKGEFI
jgi:hypothetical protein